MPEHKERIYDFLSEPQTFPSNLLQGTCLLNEDFHMIRALHTIGTPLEEIVEKYEVSPARIKGIIGYEVR